MAVQPAIVELCQAVAGDLGDLVPAIVDRIRREVPGYQAVDRTEHEHAVTLQFEGLLTGLITQRPPSAEESERARELGRRRARQGLAIESIIGAYHVGYREMWNTLLSRVGPADQTMRSDLASVVGTVWMWIEQASSAAADAYGETVRAEDALAHRFLGTLSAGGPVTAEHTRMAESLGFDPIGAFQAVCSPADAWRDEDTTALRDQVRSHRGTLMCAVRDDLLIAVLQSIPASVFVEAMRCHDARAAVGVGLVREGLAGASISIVDALEVLPAGGTGEVATFERDWLIATVRPRADRLTALLDPCRRTAQAHPDIAETVRAFAEHGFSLTSTGRALHIHPNTVRYRLERWQELTGRDARTWAGLSVGMVALDLPMTPTSN